MEIDFDQLDAAGLKKLAASGSDMPSADQLKGVKGLKVQDGEVTVEFAGKSGTAPDPFPDLKLPVPAEPVSCLALADWRRANDRGLRRDRRRSASQAQRGQLPGRRAERPLRRLRRHGRPQRRRGGLEDGHRDRSPPSSSKSDGDEKDITWPYGLETELSFEGNRLKTAIRLANKRVFKAADNREDYTGMGTTVVACLASDNVLTIGSAGDSRCYLVRDGRPHPAHPRRLVGLRRLGRGHPHARGDRAPPAQERDHQGGGRQGQHRHRHRRAPPGAGRRGHALLGRAARHDPRRADPGPADPAAGVAWTTPRSALIDAANEAGGKDNVSVVLLRYTE